MCVQLQKWVNIMYQGKLFPTSTTCMTTSRHVTHLNSRSVIGEKSETVKYVPVRTLVVRKSGTEAIGYKTTAPAGAYQSTPKAGVQQPSRMPLGGWKMFLVCGISVWREESERKTNIIHTSKYKKGKKNPARMAMKSRVEARITR